jgi:hypothetical protein
MAFVRMKGVEGLVYVPEDTGGSKKHPCDDCYYCQWCSDNRCELCLKTKACNKTNCPTGIIPPKDVKRG